MRKALRRLARDISTSLVAEVKSPHTLEQSSSTSTLGLLLDELAEEVAKQVRTSPVVQVAATHWGQANGMRDNEVGELPIRGQDDDDQDDDEDNAPGSRLPNLKYAKPKYKDVESILKYIEREDEKGGVKLVS